MVLLRNSGRPFALGVVLLGLFAGRAEATEQFEDRIILCGREHRLHSTPLEQLLEARDARPEALAASITALQRGYRARWTIHRGVLWLVGLETLSVGSGDLVYRWDSVPLASVFDEPSGAMPACWFTGTLRVPMGRLVRRVRMGFASVFETTRILRIRSGRYIGSRMEDSSTTRWRSDRDLYWTAAGQAPTPRDSDWVDARVLANGAASTSQLTTLVSTRGVLVDKRAVEGATYLWIPRTPSTRAVWIPMRASGRQFGALPRSLAHVEVRARLAATSAGPELHDVAVRSLSPGQSIHHPSYPQQQAGSPGGSGSSIESPASTAHVNTVEPTMNPDSFLGLLVELIGPVKIRDGVATVRGIRVRAPREAVLGDLVFRGVLKKYVCSRSDAGSSLGEQDWMSESVPGVWVLIDPDTKQLAGIPSQK